MIGAEFEAAVRAAGLAGDKPLHVRLENPKQTADDLMALARLTPREEVAEYSVPDGSDGALCERLLLLSLPVLAKLNRTKRKARSNEHIDYLVELNLAEAQWQVVCRRTCAQPQKFRGAQKFSSAFSPKRQIKSRWTVVGPHSVSIDQKEIRVRIH